MVACAASDHVVVGNGSATSGDTSGTTPAVSDAASFCSAMCGREQSCDKSIDSQTCVNECTNANAAVFPRLRSDVVGLVVACFDNKDCKTVLGGEFVGACTADAIASVAPSSAAASFCDALAASKNKCGASQTSTKAQCLNSAKLYGDLAIAQAQNCVKRGCAEIDTCVAAVFGSLGGSSSGTTTGGGTTTGSGSCSGKFTDLGSCSQCAQTSCCTEATACYADSECQYIATSCFNGGTSSSACSSAYSSASSSAQSRASAFLSCSTSKCSGTCQLGQ